MNALDTNILVRLLVDDDPRQQDGAVALLERGIAADESFFVADIVLCELVWVLTTAYSLRRTEILDALRELLRARHLVFAAPERLARTLSAYQAGRGDFADYLIREHATAAGCDKVVTFDRALLKEPDFVAPPEA